MARFSFRLDPVLDHRRRLEEEQQVRFAAALQRVAEAERVRAAFAARRDAMHERIRSEHAMLESDELRAAYAHCEFLERAIVTQDGVIAETRAHADAERERLLAATKDKNVLETLRERRLETFTLDAAAHEQREMDEINARRFDRSVIAGGRE